MGVTFEDMVVKSMRLYWKKTDQFDGMSSTKANKYNKSYFDGIEKEMLPANQTYTKPTLPKDDIMGIPGMIPPPNGPIPGENFTSDTKNYPWHRPPEITNLDQGIELAAKQLMDEEKSHGLLTMMQMGTPLNILTDIFVTSGIGAGKWTPDFAILLAGPVSHIMMLMAKAEGIEPDLGIDLKKNTHTISYMKAIQEDQSNIANVYKALDDPQVVQHAQQAVKGFMGMGQQMVDQVQLLQLLWLKLLWKLLSLLLSKMLISSKPLLLRIWIISNKLQSIRLTF